MLPNLVGSNHAWCASFVNYCLQEVGYAKSHFPFRARSFIGDSNFSKYLSLFTELLRRLVIMLPLFMELQRVPSLAWVVTKAGYQL